MVGCWSLLDVVEEYRAKSASEAPTAESSQGAPSAEAQPTTVATNNNLSQNSFPAQFDAGNSSNSYSTLPTYGEGIENNNESGVQSNGLTYQPPFILPRPPFHNYLVHGPYMDFSMVHGNIGAGVGVAVAPVVTNTHPVVQSGSEQQQQQVQPPHQMFMDGESSDLQKKLGIMSKKKKFEERRVCRYTAEELSTNDKWSWRKYGQKPIKGSPNPRSYYRCSSHKGCTARKLVERSADNDETFIVTYTGYHDHPCPPNRNTGGPRVKNKSGADQPHEPRSPTSIILTKYATVDPTCSGSGSGSEIGSGGNFNKLVDDEQDDGSGGGNGGGNGGNQEGNNNFDMDLIPDPIMDPDILMAMELLVGQDGKDSTTSIGASETVNSDNVICYGYEFDFGESNDGLFDPTVNMGVQENATNGSGFGFGYGNVGIQEVDSLPTTDGAAHESANNEGLNNWNGDDAMYRPQFLF